MDNNAAAHMQRDLGLDNVARDVGILQLGHPLLRGRSSPVDPGDFLVSDEVTRLQLALQTFRSAMGFGRAVAAPQLGIPKRFIAFDVGAPFVMINPRILRRSCQCLTLWDDCMSFPSLLVLLERSVSLDVEFSDALGYQHVWCEVPPALAELIQHEVDHLDGVLALDRALDREAVVSRVSFEEFHDVFTSAADQHPDQQDAEDFVLKAFGVGNQSRSADGCLSSP